MEKHCCGDSEYASKVGCVLEKKKILRHANFIIAALHTAAY
jgi:hypothetical protein